MSIMSICDNVDVLSVLRIVKIVITIIKIVVPILLILSLSFKYLSAVKSNDSDLLAKANKSAITVIIAAILVFFIPTFVNILANISSFNSVEFFKCINNSSSEKISVLRVDNANNSIDAVKKNPTNLNYTLALSTVNKVKDPTQKSTLMSELESYKKYVDITEALSRLENKKTKENKKKASELIEALPDDDPYKEGFLAKLKELGVGVPLNLAEGVYTFKFKDMTYFLHVPPEATTNMPLLLWLHGDNFREEWSKNPTLVKNAYKAGYPIIAVHPFVGAEMGHSVSGWYEGGLLPTVKELVDEVCETYECDKDNINIGGHSRGAIGTWMMVTKYPNFFHSAAPVSCCSFYGIKGESFKGMKVWAWRGSGAGSGDNNDDIYSCMQGDVNAVKPFAKEVRYTIQPNTTHGDATNKLGSNVEFFKFMFEE